MEFRWHARYTSHMSGEECLGNVNSSKMEVHDLDNKNTNLSNR